MGKKTKAAGSRHGLQVVTLCISITMVLVLLGLVVFTILTARNLSAYVKENLTVTVELGDNMTQQECGAAYNRLRVRPYVKKITYISKEQAFKVNVGDSVNSGDLVLMLEAMKMENEVFATASGKVTEIRVKSGDNVSTGDILMVIA